MNQNLDEAVGRLTAAQFALPDFDYGANCETVPVRAADLRALLAAVRGKDEALRRADRDLTLLLEAVIVQGERVNAKLKPGDIQISRLLATVREPIRTAWQPLPSTPTPRDIARSGCRPLIQKEPG
jgi:hypothetical protein